MWQAPALTLVGQAFILRVLTDRSVGWTVALLAASAGVLASIAVWVALYQQRDREKLFSERVAAECDRLDWPDPRRQALRCEAGADPRRRYNPLEWRGRWLWIATVLLLGAADVLALILTPRG